MRGMKSAAKLISDKCNLNLDLQTLCLQVLALPLARWRHLPDVSSRSKSL